VTEEHARRHAAEPGSGDVWLTGFLHALEQGLVTVEEAIYSETLEEANERAGPTSLMMEHAWVVFRRMADLDGEGKGEVTRRGFCLAHRGDFGTFDLIDSDQSGHVEHDEWAQFVLQEHTARRADDVASDVAEDVASDTARRARRMGAGDKWVHSFLQQLSIGCDMHAVSLHNESPGEARGRRGPTPPMMDLARTVFETVQCRSHGEGMARDDFVELDRGDTAEFESAEFESLFDAVAMDGNAIIGMREWMDYIGKAHAAKQAEERGSGDAWLQALLQRLVEPDPELDSAPLEAPPSRQDSSLSLPYMDV
jgi:hypothetical protein